MATQIVKGDPATRSMLLTALYIAQEQNGYLTDAAMERTAERLGVPLNEVYSTATFYTLFREKAVGENLVQVCEGLSCYLNDGGERLADYLAEKLGVEIGETTEDGKFTLETVQCLAACGTAPAMRINDEIYDNLTEEKVDRILEQLARG